MSRKFALELYSVRDLYRENFEECLRRTAAIGYTGVECFGAPTLPAERVKKALDATGLSIEGWHLPIDTLEGDAFEKTVAYMKTVGCGRAVVPSYPAEAFKTREGVLALAERLTAIQKKIEPLGLKLGYHNHGAEFIPLPDGALPWQVLMDSTTILAQLDNGNAMDSKTPGLDTTEWVKKWPGRAETIHLKPYSHKTGHATMVGEDDIDWPAFFAAAEGAGGAKALIVEYEDPKYEQFEGVEKCLRALEKVR